MNIELKQLIERCIDYACETKMYIEQERYGKALDITQWMLDSLQIELRKLDKEKASNEL